MPGLRQINHSGQPVAIVIADGFWETDLVRQIVKGIVGLGRSTSATTARLAMNARDYPCPWSDWSSRECVPV